MAETIASFGGALDASEPRPSPDGTRGEKKNYAERFSRNLATLFANGLRHAFPGITPNPDGSRQEIRARTAKGFKKLDIGYATPELGLGLGVSIKTLNYRDKSSGRYTKNYSRIDNELRAEATDYHVRQPFAVLVGILFLPLDACDDGRPDDPSSASSFASAVRHFRVRTGRRDHTDDPELFERFFVGVYGHAGPERGSLQYFDASQAPPRARRMSQGEGWEHYQVLGAIIAEYDRRNDPPFEYLD